MARWSVLILFVAVALAEEGSDVLELDVDTFKGEIAGKPIMLVEFYAPW